MKIIGLMMLVFLSGCAIRSGLEWQHIHGDNDRQLQIAQKECRQLAHREARYPSYFHTDPLFPFYRPFNYYGRHYDKGYLWHDHFAQLRYQDDLSRLYRICMEAKGWRLVPAQTSNLNN